MSAQARPIRDTLMTVILLTCGAVLLITSAAFVAYEYVTFRQLTVRNVKILGEAIAANSTAALAFDNPDDAREVLAAFRAQPHVVAARRRPIGISYRQNAATLEHCQDLLELRQL